MQFLLALLTAGLVPSLVTTEDAPEPIKVVKIERKEPVTYAKDIEPIIVDKCLFCHTGAVTEGKLDMATYDTLMKGGKNGKAIVPGKPAESLLVKLAGRTENPVMPPMKEEPLTPEELALVKLWIEQGAKPGMVADAEPMPVGPTLGRLPSRVQPVAALAVRPDKSLIAVGHGNKIDLYEGDSDKLVRSLVNPELKDAAGKPYNTAHLDIVQALAFSPDGKTLASSGFQRVVLWDVETGNVIRELTGFIDRVVCLDFSTDGRLATGGGPPSQDGEIRVYDVANGDPVVDIKEGHSDTVLGVRFSPDGKMLATCSADKFMKVFELPSGKQLKSFEGHTHHVMDVGWKHDGKLLATAGADNDIKVWDFEKGEQARTIRGHKEQVTRLTFVGEAPEFVTASGDATVIRWNVDKGNRLRNFGGNKDFLYALAVSPDGELMAAGGQEGVVRVYNNDGKVLRTLSPGE